MSLSINICWSLFPLALANVSVITDTIAVASQNWKDRRTLEFLGSCFCIYPSSSHSRQPIIQWNSEKNNWGVSETDGNESKESTPDHQIIVVKPKKNSTENKNPIDSKQIETALQSIPVSKCKKTNSGALLVQLPSKRPKENASRANDNCLGPNSYFEVSEPRKLLPKMTLVGIQEDMEDGEIIPSILEKNPQIRALTTSGLDMTLLFTKNKHNSRHEIAVVKMPPETRQCIVKNILIYIGLSRCRAYDRFWVTQCHHCQGFGHTIDRCTKRNENPKCSFCAGDHKNENCTNKSSPKWINCQNSTTLNKSTTHYASSQECPLMKITKKNKVLENTALSVSKT